MDGLKWLIELRDSMTSPAAKIVRSLKEMKSGLEGASQASGGLDAAVKSTHESLGGMSLKIGAAVEGFQLLGDVVKDAGEGLFHVAEGFAHAAFKAGTFLETQEIVLKTVLGSKKAGDEFLETMTQLASKTPFKTSEIMNLGRMGLLGGFSQKSTTALTLAATDVGALNSKEGTADFGSAQQFMEMIRRVKDSGHLGGREMLLLRELNLQGSVMDILGKQKGVHGKSLDRLLATGGIDSGTAIKAILDAVASKGGGKIGGLTTEISESMGGLFSTLQSRPEELLMGIAKSPTWDSIKGTLATLNHVLDPMTDSGKRIAKELGGIFDDLFGGIAGDLSGPGGPQAIEKVIHTALGSIHEFADSIKEALAGISAKDVTEGIKGFADAMHGLWGILKPIIDTLGLLKGHGVATAGAIAGATVGGTLGIGVGAAALYADAKKTQNEVAARHGVTLHDWAGPKLASGGLVTRPTLALVGEAGPELVVPLRKVGRSSGRSSPEVNVSVQVDARGATKADADLIAEKIRSAVPSALLSALEELNLQGGAA